MQDKQSKQAGPIGALSPDATTPFHLAGRRWSERRCGQFEIG